MKITIPESITDFIHRKQLFLIISHQDPDGDCISSSLVISRLLRNLGKKTEIFSPGPFDRPEILDRAPLFKTTIKETFPQESTGVIVLDCSTMERIGPFGPLISRYETAVIDHHAGGRPFGDIEFIEPSAPSVTFLIYHLMAALGYSPSQEEAELLMLGLCTDTGFFRHIEEGRGDIFDVVARLAEAGASPKEVFQEMYGGKHLNSRILLGKVLSRTEEHFQGEVLYTVETREDRNMKGDVFRDSDTLYSLLQNSKGVEAVIYVREEDDGSVSAGLRSKTMDVSKIALHFGGGGHPRASGFTWEGTTDALQQPLLEAFKTARQN